MQRRSHLLRIRAATLLLPLVLGLLVTGVSAQTESVIYPFCSQQACADGAGPSAGVVLDSKGNLYGTTSRGGAHGDGTAFKLTVGGEERVLYSFCARAGCGDGKYPETGVLIGQNGNLYGTAYKGGFHGTGVVFKVSPEGHEINIHHFCGQDGPCPDGEFPNSSLLFDQTENLYGTTHNGGTSGDGVVFKLTLAGQETILYDFCSQFNCTDGSQPEGLVFDRVGDLYGTTTNGGITSLGGVVFKLTLGGQETVLYSFCAQNGCADGQSPFAGPALDGYGNVYGTTYRGGIYNAGVVFKVTPEGQETVLHSFSDGRDGAYPVSTPVLDQQGNVYGTTSEGGINGGGVLFKVALDGTYSILHNFCSQKACADGSYPSGPLVFDEKGNLYGTTANGGSHHSGVLFRFRP